MIKDNIRSLIYCIVLVLLLLGLCVHSDYADTNPIIAKNTSLKMPKGTVVVNDSVDEAVVVEHDGKVYTDKSVKDKPKKKKKRLPTVSMWARPSVRCGLPYKWYYRTFVDYCPHCHRYNVLYDAHKPQAKYEHEWTCKHCDADYDAVVGKEKYSWSNVYLRRA